MDMFSVFNEMRQAVNNRLKTNDVELENAFAIIDM